jgi:hypothetical protein
MDQNADTQEQQTGEEPDVTMEHVTESPDADERATEKPEVTDEHKEKAKDIAEAYHEDNLQTTTLPGSSGTVSGTAVTDWVDDEDKGKIETSADEGNIEYRSTEEFKKKLDE